MTVGVASTAESTAGGGNATRTLDAMPWADLSDRSPPWSRNGEIPIPKRENYETDMSRNGKIPIPKRENYETDMRS